MTDQPLKIALIGSAPSSVQLAPYSDPSWTIWSCSPGAVPHVKRTDTHFEIHPFEPGKPWFQPDYIAWMASLGVPVYMIEPVAAIPTSVAYPKNDILDYVYAKVMSPDGTIRDAKFGDIVAFSSSLAWMMCLAIASGAQEIGLWGVDMAANEEWKGQRQGCQTLISIARQIGIKVTIPNESDLMRPHPLYGFQETDPFYVKLAMRKREFMTQIQECQRLVNENQQKMIYLQGAMDDLEYMAITWIADPKAVAMHYAGPVPPSADSGEILKRLAETVAPALAAEVSAAPEGFANGLAAGAPH